MAGKSGKIFVVSGASAAGKTTIVNAALPRLTGSYDISRVITYTSRPRRDEEVEGKDYHFISEKEFEKKFKEGDFLETTTYAGYQYGSPRPLEGDLELGKSFIYVVDLVGAKRLAKEFDGATLIWIDPPDITVLKNRLKKRGSDSGSAFDDRVEQAKKDIEEAHKIRLFDYYLVNDVFEQSVQEFVLLVTQILKPS